MNREESAKILAIVKVSYPTSFKDLTVEDANALINEWTFQFKDTPYFLISLALQKHIACSTFPPTISEINEQIRLIGYETTALLHSHSRAVDMANDEEWKDCREMFEKDILATDTYKRLMAIEKACKKRDEQKKIPLLTMLNDDFIKIDYTDKNLIE